MSWWQPSKYIRVMQTLFRRMAASVTHSSEKTDRIVEVEWIHEEGVLSTRRWLSARDNPIGNTFNEAHTIDHALHKTYKWRQWTTAAAASATATTARDIFFENSIENHKSSNYTTENNNNNNNSSWLKCSFIIVGIMRVHKRWRCLNVLLWRVFILFIFSTYSGAATQYSINQLNFTSVLYMYADCRMLHSDGHVC